jgi:hypothetical protein
MAPKRKHRLLFLLIVMVLLTSSGCRGGSSLGPAVGQSGPAHQPAALGTTTPQEPPVVGERPADGSAITLSDSGRTFTHRVTDRFSVSLDRARYPVTTLTLTPTGVVGLVSNGSTNGPDDYPVMFEAVRPGECLLETGDFHVRIVVEP